MITLKALIQIAPFSPEKREEILKYYDQLSEDDIQTLSNLAWMGIIETYQTHLEYEKKKILNEVAEGKRKFNSNDFTEVETRFLVELREKFLKIEEQVSLEDIRSEISKYQTKPLSSDKSQPN